MKVSKKMLNHSRINWKRLLKIYLKISQKKKSDYLLTEKVNNYINLFNIFYYL